MHKYCILSVQQCEMLLYTLNLGSFILDFAIYPVAYGVGFTLLGLGQTTISNTNTKVDFKLQTTTHSGRTIFQYTQPH